MQMDGKMGVVKAEVRWSRGARGNQRIKRGFACVCACSVAKMRPVLGDALDRACYSPLSTGFPTQEYWSGSPFP